MAQRFYVYILANRSRNLYTGMTGNLKARVLQHKQGTVEGFSRRYRINRLVYFQSFDNPRTAIEWEKRVKAWRRDKKIALINAANPTWEDLAANWFGSEARHKADSSLRSE
jgi:putative endonuclease